MPLTAPAARRFTVSTEHADITCVTFGAGPPLLCLHPLAYSSEFFLSGAAALAPHFTCVALDLRGHGATRTHGVDPDLTPQAMARDALRVMDHCGWSRAAIGGISLGAAVALRLALDHAARVTQLVQDLPAFAPGPPRDPRRSDAIAAALETADLHQAAARMAEGLRDARAEVFVRFVLDRWRPFPAAELGPKLAAVFRAAARWRIVENWPADLARVAAPTAILALPGDPAHPLSVAETMAAHIPGAQLHRRVPQLGAAPALGQWAELLLSSASRA